MRLRDIKRKIEKQLSEMAFKLLNESFDKNKYNIKKEECMPGYYVEQISKNDKWPNIDVLGVSIYVDIYK